MKTISLLLSGLFPFLAMTACFAQQTTALAVVDKSGPGCPLATTGIVTIKESVEGQNEVMAYSDALKSKNISSKPIVTLVETLDVRYSNGAMERDVKQYEGMFADELILPGGVYKHTPHNESRLMTPLAQRKVTMQPRAEVTVDYALFADGSSFGNPVAAACLLRLRRLTWKTLRALDLAYKSEGEDGFAQALRDPAPAPEIEPVLDRLRRAGKQFGTQEALARLHEMLTMGEQHEAAMQGSH